MSRSEMLPDLSDVEIDESKLMQVAKLAEVGMSVAAVTHELRQPLAALKIALQMAGEKTGAEDELTKDLADALEQVLRMEMLLDRTRSFLSAPRGKKRVSLADAMSAAVALFRWQVERRRRIELVVEAQESIASIDADASLVEQLFANLLFNARDALAPQGGGRIVAIVRQSGGYVEAIVADNGPGIDPKLATKIFTPFFTTKSAESGTGLGLYISRRIAADHGAQLRLMSAAELAALDRGRLSTGFIVSFPVSQELITSPPPNALSPEKRDEAKARRVLLVDDEPSIIRILSKLLALEGFTVVTAENGEDALEHLEREDFSLLVTDKNLPGVSGIEVARFARNTKPFLPILIVTGFASEESALEALSLGVSDYVVKPLDIDDFRKRLDKVMGRNRPRDSKPASAAPAARTSRPSGAPVVSVSVLLFERDDALRNMIVETLREQGCAVEAMASDEGIVEPPPGFEVLVARPETLRKRKGWFSDAKGVLGAIAIMDRTGVDKTIEAIHLGARGVMAPPFDKTSVAFDFKRAVTRLLEEAGRS